MKGFSFAKQSSKRADWFPSMPVRAGDYFSISPCAGLYARVSTQDQQTLLMQNRVMREYAARRGWTIAMQVKEVGSGGDPAPVAGKTDGSYASP
jgi:hypothetical protein